MVFLRVIMKNAKIVVTGGLGFIGSNLANALYENNEVVILDDISTGRMQNIQELIDNQHVEFIKGSVTDFELLIKILKGVDYVFHLAAIPSVIQSISQPQLTNSVNLDGSVNVLVASKENQVKKVIFASSAAVYGNTEIIPIKEDNQTHPESPYGAQKLGGEHYLRVFYEVYGLATTSLRYFNVFGPNQDPGSQYSGVIPKFISAISRNSKPTIYGDGNQTRDFIYVGDVIQANLLAAEISKSNGKTVNIACGMQTSINDLAETIINLMGKKIEPVHAPQRKGEIFRSFADISFAQQILGFKPSFSLEKGLSVTIEHFTEHDQSS
jgi:UDP-glucose 4-epimerase